MEGLDEDYESIPGTSLAINMIAGAMAGMTEHSVMYPFDSIKVNHHLISFLNSHSIYRLVCNS